MCIRDSNCVALVGVNEGWILEYLEQAYKFLVNPSIAVSGGNFRNLKTTVPKGTCFNPKDTAPCLHYGHHLMLAMDLVIKALSKVVPDRAAAGHVGDSWNVTLVGENKNGLFLSGESLVGGWGAYDGGNGESALIHSAAGDFSRHRFSAGRHDLAANLAHRGSGLSAQCADLVV